MDRMTIAEIERAVDGTLLIGDRDQVVTGVSTDSRTAGEGDLFVPIIGEVHDAHKFIPMAAENGCKAFFVSRRDAADGLKDCSVIVVDDTTRALQALAAWYLKELNLKTIAVTGSVGKTSTRDMAACILKTRYKTGVTIKNYNSDVGVPLTVFSFDRGLEAAVLEVGMDHSGEIHRLVDMIRPDVGIITNVGISHIENLGSREGILAAKLEITDYFDEKNTLIINQDNDMLQAADLNKGYKVVRAGTTADCDYYIHDIEDYGQEGSRCVLTVGSRDHRLSLAVPGAHNVCNAALAIAACARLGVDIEDAIGGLADLALTGSRLTIREGKGKTIIDDTYNAAPDSVRSAINTLMHTKGGRRAAILADMNELGTDSALYHRQVGQYAAEQSVDLLLTVGQKAKDIGVGAREASEKIQVRSYETKTDLLAELDSLLKPDDVILVKGSRTMEMNKIVDKLIEEQE